MSDTRAEQTADNKCSYPPCHRESEEQCDKHAAESERWERAAEALAHEPCHCGQDGCAFCDQPDEDETPDATGIKALSNAGAFCGNCGFEPGDRGCPDCRSHWAHCIEKLRAAGWAPRHESYREAAAEADQAGGVYAARGQSDHAWAAFALMENLYRKANEVEYAATPCDRPNTCDTDEPCATHERLTAHQVGEHELCGDKCAPLDKAHAA